jgi:hypothetical protein
MSACTAHLCTYMHACTTRGGGGSDFSNRAKRKTAATNMRIFTAIS